MADEIRQYTVSVPAGTTADAPLTVPMVMPPRIVDALQIVVPPGPSGLVGFAVLVGGVRIIPYGSDLWIITAGENITWPLDHYPDAGSWSVQAYNTGVNDHSIYFRWLVRYISSAPVGAAPPMIDDVDIAPMSVAL
jgi:hypothetical protein